MTPLCARRPDGTRAAATALLACAASLWLAGAAAAQPREVWKGQSDYVNALASLTPS